MFKIRYQSHENIASLTSLGIVKTPGWLNQHSPYQWNCSFFRTDLSTHLAPVPRFQTCLSFLLLLPLLVMYQIQLCNIVKLQHSPFSNYTSIATYIHWMIISPRCLFKHMKNNEHVAMLSQCLLDLTQQKLYFCLFSLLRNNVSKSVYINLRHTVFKCLFVIFWIAYLFACLFLVHIFLQFGHKHYI